MNKKAEIGIVTGLIILIAVGVVIFETLGIFSDKSDTVTVEQTCRKVNEVVQQTDINALNQFNLKACRMVELGALNGANKVEVMKQIADHVGKTWWIFLEGTKETYFGKNWADTDKKCMVLYSFTLDKEFATQITSTEFVEYLKTTPYKVIDASDRCAGEKGGICKNSCAVNEKEVKTAGTCTGELPVCCLPKNGYNACEAKGGTCLASCGAGQKTYSDWKCGENNVVCCVKEQNTVSYLDYVYKNGGTVTIDQKSIYPQNFKVNGQKTSVVYAIVFASRMKLAPFGITIYSGDTDNTNQVIVAPFDQVKDICNLQAG